MGVEFVAEPKVGEQLASDSYLAPFIEVLQYFPVEAQLVVHLIEEPLRPIFGNFVLVGTLAMEVAIFLIAPALYGFTAIQALLLFHLDSN